jgi:hypothetical protein
MRARNGAGTGSPRMRMTNGAGGPYVRTRNEAGAGGGLGAHRKRNMRAEQVRASGHERPFGGLGASSTVIIICLHMSSLYLIQLYGSM